MNNCNTTIYNALEGQESGTNSKIKNKEWYKIYLVLVLLFFSNIVSSQDYIDIFKSDYSISPSNTFDSSSAETQLQEINGDLIVPVKISDRLALLTGITYENISASFDSGRNSESVTGLTVKLGANIKYNSKWSGTYMLLPKISSDLKRISSRDFQFGGAVLMKYKKSDNFNYKFGMYANKELFGSFIVPIVGFYYQSPSEKFEAKVLLPLSVDMNYSLIKRFRIGLSFKGQVRSYNLNNSFGTEKNRYLTKSTNDLYTYFQYETKKGLNFQIGFGHSIARSYRVFDESVSLGVPLAYFGDTRRQLNTDFSDGWLIKTSVFYRLNLDKKEEESNRM